VSISKKNPVDSKLSFDFNSGSFNFVYSGEKVEVNALDLSPIYSDKELLKAEKYLAYYKNYALEDKEGHWDAIVNEFEPLLNANPANK